MKTAFKVVGVIGMLAVLHVATEAYVITKLVLFISGK
jgi:hypothetical protein